MYSGSSDGEAHDAPQRKIPPASSMLWVRNLRRFIGSGAGLGSEALMELETKRILLDIFKEKQKKSAEGALICLFFVQKPEDGSISHRVQRLAKYRFLRKQSDLLLNADDLDAMWVCLRENCVIDDATGAEKMNYEDFCHIASVCTEQIGPKCRRFFSPSNFMKFEKDEQGRIAILPFYLYVMRTVSLTQARIDMSELDEDSDGFLQPHEMEAYIRGLIPNLAQLRDMPAAFVQMYCRIAAHKFFFFCDPHRRGKACIKKVLLSNCLQELMELHQESEEEVTDTEQAENWFSLTSAQRICDMFLALDKDTNGTLSKQELREYADGTLTDIFIERDKMTLTSVISSCSQLGDLEHWYSIESRMKDFGIVLDDHLATALIDLYAKCGSIDKAYELFHSLRKKDLVAYSAMIYGCGINGKAYDAIKLFEQMLAKCIGPNLVTYTGLLTAYNHAGMVEKGYQCFNSMKNYGLVPSMDHYGIMVDLLGRAGYLDEAYKLVINMPMQPNGGVWGALLHACRLHNNVELGEIAVQHCIKLENDTTGYCSLLSSIYATVGKWHDAKKFRMDMEGKKIIKIPGCSWTSI
uniref:Pentatricopeptide repeat-containing protein At4g22765 family n=1 Tax=Cajanus cajan TaxID=3821 RepID=A0A151STH1_CAJCA|nr:Pentatricopeptide repeat-containing protein At4g22765 family [Cajanus cajan]